MSETYAYASKDIRNTLIRGVSWQGFAEVCRVVASFVVMIVLATRLVPADFGIVGMTDVFVSLFMVFMAMGFDSAIVQQETLTDNILSTLFWINVALGICLTTAGVAVAPLVGWFYQEPGVTVVFAVVSATFAIEGLSVVQRGLLQRQMKFRNLATIDISTTLGASAIALALALLGGGYWSLVAQQLCRCLFAGIGYWMASRWRPLRQLDLRAARNSIRFSLNLLLYNSLNFATTRVDSLLIGRLLGAQELGIYLLARQLVTKPVGHALDVLNRTLYPVLTAIRTDTERIRDVFVGAFRSVLLLLGPLIVIMAVAAPFLVPIHLGEPWSPLVPVLWVWCLGAIRGIVTSRVMVLFLAAGRPDRYWKYQALAAPIVILGMAVGVRWGALGVSDGYTLAQTAMQSWAVKLALPLIDLRLSTYLQSLQRVALALLASILVGAVGMWAASVLVCEGYLGVALAASPATAAYCWILYRCEPSARDLWDLLKVRFLASGRAALAWWGLR